MKIKLRDITREQYKKWNRNNMCEACDDCIFRYVYCHSDDCECWIYHKEMFSDKFLDQEIEIEDEPILTEEEREYLRAVIKPFRDNVLSIVKRLYLDWSEIIEIFVRTYDSDEEEEVALPSFKKGTMYKGMEKWERYTLEELGL